MVSSVRMGNAKSLIKKAKMQKLRPDAIAELQRHEDVDLSRKEIEEWYAEYETNLDEGFTKLTVNVFQKIYNRVFIGDASTFAYHLFRSFDLDGDGYVDFKEFIIGLCVSGSKNLDKKVNWAFKMYDINGNGKISKKEMITILDAIYKMTHALVGGKLGSPEEITDNFFERFDLDRDGLISFQEFRNGVLTDPKIIYLLQCDPHP